MRIQFGTESERYDPYMDMPVYGRHAKSGGSSSTTSVDAVYNARMASIAEAQQGQAEWYFDWMKGEDQKGYYEGEGTPLEIETVPGEGLKTNWGTFPGIPSYKVGEETFTTMEEAQEYADANATDRTWVEGSGSSSYMDLEQAKIEGNMELLPAQTDLSMEQIASARELLPGQTSLTGEQIGAARELLPGQTALSKEQTALGTEKAGFQREMMPAYFDSVREGADIGGRMNRASADVSQQFADVPGQVRREAGRMGMMPSSNRTLSRLADVDINRNKALATARTGARVQGEAENLTNLRQAMTT